MNKILIILSLIAGGSMAHAQEWVLGAGYADFSNSLSMDDALISFELHGEPFYETDRFELGLAGAAVGHMTGDVFVGVGLAGLFELDKHWFIEGSIMPGYYRASSPQNNLGSDFEIRSLLGIGFTFKSGDRLSLALAHISNASTSSVNPGVDSLQIRLRRRF